MNENYVASVFDTYEPLTCKKCQKDLLEEGQGVVALAYPLSSRGSERTVVAAYTACKGKCDRFVRSVYRKMGCGTIHEDLEDLIHPHGFLRWDSALRNRLFYANRYYSDEAFETLNVITLKISQKVLRQPTPEEREKFLEDQRWRDLGLS
jgi:hypothetical protein